ncbi:hypothetical protein Tco_1265194 [Tanacetum coccineum]
MVNTLRPPFPLPPLRQLRTSLCDCSMNIRNTREELHNFVDEVCRMLVVIRLDIVKLIASDEDELDRMFLEQPNKRKRRHKDKDKDPYAGSNQGKRKRSSGKDSEPSKTPSASKKTYTSKDTSKGNTPPKTSKSDKSVHEEELVVEPT